jgi:hypothetical protein
MGGHVGQPVQGVVNSSLVHEFAIAHCEILSPTIICMFAISK